MVECRCHTADLIVRIDSELLDREIPACDLLSSAAHANERLRCLGREEVREQTGTCNENDAEDNNGDRRLSTCGDDVGARRRRRNDPARGGVLRIAHIVLIPVEELDLGCSRLS